MDMESLNLLGEMENYLENCKKALFSGQYMVDRDVLMQYVTAIRDALPTEYKDAVNVLRQESRLLQNANRYADTKTAEAEAKARSVVVEAEQRAQDILAEAKARAQELEQRSQEQAARTIEAAQRKADEMVSQTAIMTRAELQANETLIGARSEAERIRLMNLDHCDALLRQVEDKAMDVAHAVRESRNQLNDSR